MFYNEKTPLRKGRKTLIEVRTKVTQEQKTQLQDMESRLSIPVAILIRMALDSFLPKVKNSGFSEDGILNGFIDGNY